MPAAGASAIYALIESLATTTALEPPGLPAAIPNVGSTTTGYAALSIQSLSIVTERVPAPISISSSAHIHFPSSSITFGLYIWKALPCLYSLFLLLL
ncbi:MAG: hypothetical protein DRO23_09410 [Thermoprotei archaeon]|nr:MAG: hypothetical protein DRO23_09410 [Thermoprotei archaeon]